MWGGSLEGSVALCLSVFICGRKRLCILFCKGFISKEIQYFLSLELLYKTTPPPKTLLQISMHISLRPKFGSKG